MAYGHVYTVRHNAAVSTAITILQIKTGAASPAEILRAWINQRGSTTSAQEEITLLRKTAAATVTTGAVGTHVFKHRNGDPTPDLSLGTAATGVIGTAEGTDGDIIERYGFNVLSGWEKVYLPEERIVIPAGGIVALKFFTAPANQNWQFGMDVRELG